MILMQKEETKKYIRIVTVFFHYNVFVDTVVGIVVIKQFAIFFLFLFPQCDYRLTFSKVVGAAMLAPTYTQPPIMELHQLLPLKLVSHCQRLQLEEKRPPKSAGDQMLIPRSLGQ